MAFRYFNNNPYRRSTGDCVIRASSIVTGQTWDDTYWDIAKKGFELGDMPSNNAVWGEYLRDKGFKRFIIPDTYPDCYSVDAFARDNPRGMYVLGTGSHAVSVVNGDVIDAWDSRNEIPIYYYRRES